MCLQNDLLRIMQSYTDFPYTEDDDNKLWSSFLRQEDGGAYDDFDPPLYSSMFPATTPPHHFSVNPNTSTLPVPPIVIDYGRRHSMDFAPFQDLIDRRNWCLNNLRLTAKEAEALRQENVNLQMANSELNKQLSHLQHQASSASVSATSRQNYGNATMFPSVNSVADSFERMRIGEKGALVSDKRVARGVENVDPVKKTNVERVKLPKSISVRSNGYLKNVQAGDGAASRVRAPSRVKPAADMVNT